MKQLFIALVVINLGYPVLQRLFGAQEPVHTESATATIAMQTSTDPDALAFIPGPDAGQRSATSTVATTPTPRPQTVQTLPQLSQQAVQDTQQLPQETVQDTQQLPQDDQRPEPTQVALGPESLRAQGPVGGNGGRNGGRNGAAPATECVIAGPFRNKGDAEALVASLAKEDVKSILQPRDTAVLPDYMVYVGPQANVEDARKLVKMFAEKNMDSHLITSGNLRNALSLGVFSRAPLAESMLARLKRDGYVADIAVMARNRRGYQVRTSLSTPLRARLRASDTPMVDCPAEPVSASLAKVP